MADAHEFADAFCADVLQPLVVEGQPFALLGHSDGARLCYEVARRVSPVRVYVVGRAGPHCGARGEPREADDDPEVPEAIAVSGVGDLGALARWVEVHGRGDAATAALQQCFDEADEEGTGADALHERMAPFLEGLAVGWTEMCAVDGQGRLLRQRLPCRIQLYESTDDRVWPPSTIRNSWDRYAPAAGSRCKKKTYKNASHEDMCPPLGGVLLQDVLADLRSLVTEALAAKP